MKKFLRFAVLAAIAVVCAILGVSCTADAPTSYDVDTKGAPVIIIKPRKVSCEVLANNVTYTGAVTRAEGESLDGDVKVVSSMLAKFTDSKKDTVKYSYEVLNMVEAYNVKAPKYLKSPEVLKDATLAEANGLWKLSFGGAHISFKVSQEIKETSYTVEDTSFDLCQNSILGLSLEKFDWTDLKKDSANYHLYQGIPSLVADMEEGKDVPFTTAFKFWVPKGGDTPVIPEDKPEVISYEDDDSGWTFVSNGKNKRWLTLIPRLSDGTQGDRITISFVAEDYISAPAKQEKRVSSLEWSSEEATIASPVKDGELLSIGDSIFHQPMKVVGTTRVNHGSCQFVAHYDGVAYYVDKFGVNHTFAEKAYTLSDKGWTAKDLSAKDGLEGKLLTSKVSGSINGHATEAKGEIEIRKAKDTGLEIVDYEYPATKEDRGIRTIIPNKEYEVWQNQYAVYSDGSKAKLTEVKVPVTMSVTTPDKQVIDLTDWDLKDAKMVEQNPIRNSVRELTIGDGKAKVTKFEHRVTTKTNRSSHQFSIFVESSATFTDKFGNSVELPSLKVSFADKGGVKSLTDLPTQDGKERKLYTSTLAVTANGTDTADYNAEVEFRKVKDTGKDIIDYEYPTTATDRGIRTITPNKEYEVWQNQYAVYSDGSKVKLTEVKVPVTLSVTTPDKQVIDLTAWDLSDVKMVTTDPVAAGSRELTIGDGKATVKKVGISVTTKTNHSAQQFNVLVENEVVYTDKFGNSVELPSLKVTFADKGGVATLSNLPNQDGKERKLYKSTLAVTANGTDTANYTAEVEFRKPEDKEELTGQPTVTNQTLVYNGNGNWTTTTTVNYPWKLAGNKTETYKTNLIWNIVGESKKQVVLDEAKADYNTLTSGAETSSTTTNDHITVVTKKKSYMEDYTTLQDNYTATMQTASYKNEVGGYTVNFDFLSPTGMMVTHKDGSLTDTGKTTQLNGQEYEVWNHKGSVTATVASSVGNQTETAADEKDVLVKVAPTPPAHPEWGAVEKMISATWVYNKNAGESGRFHISLLIQFEKGVLVVTTQSFGGTGNAWYPRDYTFQSSDFYTYGVDIQKDWKLNTSMLWDGKFIPALWSWDGNSDNPGWTVECINNQFYKMSEAQALACGIKNFQGSSTAETTPALSFSGKVINGVLHIYDHKGKEVFSIN